jgi:hypothetical protein
MSAGFPQHDSTGRISREPWPQLEARIRHRVAAGATVTRQGEWVEMDMPGGTISWARAECFDRAMADTPAATAAAEAGIAVLPPAPFDTPIKAVPSAALADFLAAAGSTRPRQHG